MFPNAERAIKKFKALEALADPKTAEKNNEAASCFDSNSAAFGTKWEVSGGIRDPNMIEGGKRRLTSCEICDIAKHIEDSY